MLTAISMSAIATNGVVPGKYFHNEVLQQFYHSRLHHFIAYFVTRTLGLYFYDIHFLLNNDLLILNSVLFKSKTCTYTIFHLVAAAHSFF